MNILNYMQKFPDEAFCIAYLKEQREHLLLLGNIVVVWNTVGTP